MATFHHNGQQYHTKHQAAQAWLLDRLQDDQPQLATELQAAAVATGIGKRTLHRAKQAVGVQAVRKAGRWYWALTTKQEHPK